MIAMNPRVIAHDVICATACITCDVKVRRDASIIARGRLRCAINGRTIASNLNKQDVGIRNLGRQFYVENLSGEQFLIDVACNT